MGFVDRLRVWRKNRNITVPNTDVYVANIIEELLEIYFKNKRVIKFLQFLVMIVFSVKKPISEHEIVDAISDIKVFSINEVENMGYDVRKTMNETILEINSRVQDPEQRLLWSEIGPVGKWKKDPDQDKSTLYKADYTTCKK